MRATLAIAGKDLTQRIRDKSLFVIAIIAPLALAFIFNVVFGDTASDVGQTVTFDVGIVNEDNGSVATAFESIVAHLEEDGLFAVSSFETVSQAREAIENDTLGAVFHLPSTLTSDVGTGADSAIRIIGNVDRPTTVQVASAVAEQFADGVRRGNTAAVASMFAGAIDPTEIETVATAAATTDQALRVGEVAAATRQLNAPTFFVAGLSVFFLFFIAGMAVTSMLSERREGTLSRLLAAPISPASIVGGKSATSVAIGIVAMTILVVASTFLMGASWGPAIGVSALVIAVVLAIVALMTFVGGFANTAEQAGNLQAIVGVTLAMLGGTFVPIAGDGILSKLSLITPNAWFLQGLGDMAGGGTAADAMPAVGVLLAMAIVAGLFGLTSLRKAVQV